MAKVFSTKTHGLLDYLTVGQLFVMPRMLGWNEGPTQWLTGMALGTLANSIVTRYEFGPLKLLPVKGHLTIDFMQGLMFCAFPFLFPRESTGVKATVVGLGLFELFASLSTETEPSYGEQVSQLNDEISDTLQDATDGLRAHEIGA